MGVCNSCNTSEDESIFGLIEIETEDGITM